MNIIEGNFFNFRMKDEMPLWKRIIWQIFGERLEGGSKGYKVIAYRFRNVTLIVMCEPVESYERNF